MSFSKTHINHVGPSFTIENPTTGNVFPPPRGRYWVFNEAEVLKRIEDGRIIFGKSGTGRPIQKKFLSERNSLHRKAESWWDSHGMNEDGSSELARLISPKVFDHPKPSVTLKHLCNIATQDDDIVFDFFSGTASSAHAVLDLNKEDGGNRKFIMVQLPEPCDEKSEAAKAGYKTIADIGKERIRRVIKKIELEQAEAAKKAEGELKLGDKNEPKPQDLGFRVLKLNKSNFKVWQPLPADASEEEIKKALQGHLFHVDETATQEDILYEILLKAGFMPSMQVETLKLAGKTVYSVAEGILFICLEDEITRELIDAVVGKLPQQFICLDLGFKGNDQLKANAVQTFAALNESKDQDTKIIFRTV